MTQNAPHDKDPGLCDNSITAHIEPYLKTEELAEVMRVQPDTVRHWCCKYRDFPVLRLGNSNRFRVSEVVAFFQRPRAKTRRRRKGARYDS